MKKHIGYLVVGFSDDISKIVVLNERLNTTPQNAPVVDQIKKKHDIQIENLWFLLKYLDKKWAEMLEYLPENDVLYATIEDSSTEIYFMNDFDFHNS